jgi:mannose-6-phosphate isomerase
VSTALYPLVLEPQQREAIWGDGALGERYGKPPAAAGHSIGESWECWDENRVVNGAYAGETLGALRARLAADLTGGADPTRLFALLTKLIDAHEALSVQVHPDDAYAERVEHQPVGKTECWYVLEAAPGASLVLGWQRATSRDEFLERVADGSLGELLHRVPVHPGESFYLPAGMLHAIGAGIVLFETQQASDLTYRVFDYNRTGPDGKPRTLHVDKAADVLDFRASAAGPLRGLSYRLDGLRRTTLVAGSQFSTEHVRVDDERRGLDLEGGPLVVMALGAPVELEARGTAIRLEPYQTAVVPAALDVVMLRAFESAGAVLTAAPAGDREALPRRYARAAVPVDESTGFLAQF